MNSQPLRVLFFYNFFDISWSKIYFMGIFPSSFSPFSFFFLSTEYLKRCHFIVKHLQTWFHLLLSLDSMYQSWLQGGGNNSCKSPGLTSRYTFLSFSHKNYLSLPLSIVFFLFYSKNVFIWPTDFLHANHSLVYWPLQLHFLYQVWIERWADLPTCSNSWFYFDTFDTNRCVMLIVGNVHGSDERGRMIRRTMARYLILLMTLTCQAVSTSVRRRFPTLDHIVEAGIMTKEERIVYDNIPSSHGKWWAPVSVTIFFLSHFLSLSLSLSLSLPFVILSAINFRYPSIRWLRWSLMYFLWFYLSLSFYLSFFLSPSLSTS